MEYHFTGTGGSPDFTFIADGIIDGTGKFIFYTAIKNIKVTRKGGNAALIITSAESGVKEQCVYLVDGKDETALKAALSEMGFYLDSTQIARATRAAQAEIDFRHNTAEVI